MVSQSELNWPVRTGDSAMLLVLFTFAILSTTNTEVVGGPSFFFFSDSECKEVTKYSSKIPTTPLIRLVRPVATPQLLFF